MGKFDQPGYPLPDGELGEDEIVCQLVYLPDRPEYWQALIGALHYMTTWRAWERDEARRGKDAAANWRASFELTMECWRMTCIEDLKANVAAILALMQSNAPCCGDYFSYSESTTYITIIDPGVGDDPEFYGETAVADWEEWLEYLCYTANAWVDHLVTQANRIEVALSIGGLGLAMLAYAFGAINFLLLRGDINTSTLMLRVVNIIAGYSVSMFSDASDAIEAGRDDIVCTIMRGHSVSDAVEDALSSGAAWDLFFSLVDYDSAVAILYEGGDGETYLDAEPDATCDCEQVGEFLLFYEFPSDDEDWDEQGTAGWVSMEGNPPGCLRYLNRVNNQVFVRANDLRLAVGQGDGPALDWIKIHRCSFDYSMVSAAVTGWSFVGTEMESMTNVIQPSWNSVEYEFDPPLKIFKSSYAIRFITQSDNGSWIYVDNVMVDFDTGSDA